MSISKGLALLGLVMAILDFTDMNAVLERWVDAFIDSYTDLVNRYAGFFTLRWVMGRAREDLRGEEADLFSAFVVAIILAFVYKRNSVYSQAYVIVIGLFAIIFIIKYVIPYLAVFVLRLLKFVLHLMNAPKKGFLGTVGLLLAVVGMFV